MRKGNAGGGRSINQHLSNRGICFERNEGLADAIQNGHSMHGRMIHAVDGQLIFNRMERRSVHQLHFKKWIEHGFVGWSGETGCWNSFNSRIESIDLVNTKLVHRPQSMVNGGLSSVDSGLIIRCRWCLTPLCAMRFSACKVIVSLIIRRLTLNRLQRTGPFPTAAGWKV